MGLAHALHGQGSSAIAATMAAELIEEFPTYLSAYDFLAQVREDAGDLAGAQAALQRAIAHSPRNTLRQRELGEIAMRNGDYQTAEQAFALALERSRRSSMNELDDYSNLSRALLEQQKADAALAVARDLRKDYRGNVQAELAALVVDILAFEVSDLPEQARASLDRALDLHQKLSAEDVGNALTQRPISSRLAVDLGRACLSFGIKEKGIDLLRQVAAENLDKPGLMAHIEHVFAQTGDPDGGKALIDAVTREIVAINNRGVLKAREGDLEGAVELLIEAAERMPNLQFLVNASKAIFTLLDKIGWDEKLADQARRYALRARAREPANAKVISAWSLYQQVGAKYGINVPPMNIAAAAAGND
jgi:tetratricopeptide (TPR) repeat protein